MSDSYHHGQLRLALVAEALRVVRAGEIESFSLRACAKALGVTPAAVYHHFADKNALLDAVSKEVGLALYNVLSSVAAKRTKPSEHAMQLGLAYIDFALAEPFLFAQLTGRDCAEAREVQAMNLELVERAIVADHAPAILSPAALQDKILSSWALSHGFAALALSKRVSAEQIRGAFRRQCHPNG